jgi:hypothetical protein
MPRVRFDSRHPLQTSKAETSAGILARTLIVACRRPGRSLCQPLVGRDVTMATVTGHAHRPGYLPLTVADLGKLMSGVDQSGRWRLVAEFLEDYRHEATGTRLALLEEEPRGTGDVRWDVFLAGLAEHLAELDGRAGPPWADQRSLRQFWFPFNTRAARVNALVHAPAAFRRRGVRGTRGIEGCMSEPGPLLDRAAIQEAFRRLGDRLVRRDVGADIYVIGGAAMALALGHQDACGRRHGDLAEHLGICRHAAAHARIRYSITARSA